MKVIFGLTNFKRASCQQPIVITIGNFDGVHLAHCRIIRSVIRRAHSLKGTSIILTFHPHPGHFTAVGRQPLLLTSLEHKIKLLGNLNPQICLFVKFDKRIARLSAEDFTRKILICNIGVKEIFVGDKFRFGYDKNGDIRLLSKLADVYRFRLKIFPTLIKHKVIISSSNIRKLINTGRLKQASSLLGRNYSLWGRVVKGKRRGIELGFPTANIITKNEILPPRGAYAVKIELKNKIYDGMLNIGTRPTFNTKAEGNVIEVHIFNFKKNIYGHNVEIYFINKLRGEKKFRNSFGLRKQLRIDKKMAMAILKYAHS